MSIGTALGSIASAGMNMFSQNATNLHNEQMVRQQNEWNLTQWQRENAYNHPVNQVQRLRSAGINPGILYGSGGVTNTSAPSPTMQASKDVAPQIAGLDLGNPLQDAATMAQIDNIRADTEKKRAETETENQMRQSRIDNLNASTANLYKQNEHIVQQIENLVKEGKLTDKQIEQFKFDNIMRGKQFALDRQRLQNETRMTDKQISALDADIQKTLAEKRVTDREYEEMIWTFAIRKSGLANAVNLSAAQISQANATARKLGFDADMLEASAGSEKYYSESLRGQHGAGDLIVSTVRSGVQMVLRDFGTALGGLLK